MPGRWWPGRCRAWRATAPSAARWTHCNNVLHYSTDIDQVEELRSLKEQQEAQLERRKFEKKEKTTFYKPAMAVKSVSILLENFTEPSNICLFRTSKSSGALYFTEPVARSGLFSTRS